ncbi:Maf family protein [Anaerovorax sp. IOR16]|uniref:Maf family protein n=1 Tax=Anaerovorax sp. IOR16 TaxID=2773458 RepID=UPI0019D0E578|nr:Maf family protein [Anaerovorax sp. IOR16]
MKSKIILASGSPRRVDMMQKHGIFPEIIKPEVDETLPKDISVCQSVMYLALKKALYVEKKCQNGIILAADTLVYKNEILGKPKDYEDAVRILKLLRNKKHLVLTGVAIVEANTTNRRVFYESTEVIFKNYSDQDIIDYIESGEVWDKAGAYAIQGSFSKYIDAFIGDYDNVVGFPWKRILKELDFLGFGEL